MTTWRERIVAAAERRRFTKEDKELAGDWTTCAVGEQRIAHPLIVEMPVWGRPGLQTFGSPKDDVLLSLGGEAAFYDAVRRHHYRRAEKILDAIEDRVLQLKREAQ